MKIVFKILFFITLFFYNNLLYADNNIAYLDMNIIYNKSIAGKFILDELDKKNKNNISKFKKIEETLKKEEQEISSQKNILTKEEYEKRVVSFKKNVTKYKSDRNKSIAELKKKREMTINTFSTSVNKILADYSVEKKISIIIPKKNIIIGKVELEITKDILELVNNNIKKISVN